MVDFTGGTWRSLIDGSEVSAIPDSGGDHQWNFVEGSGTTVTDQIGDLDADFTDLDWGENAGAEGTFGILNGSSDHAILGDDVFTEILSENEGTIASWHKHENNESRHEIFCTEATGDGNNLQFGADPENSRYNVGLSIDGNFVEARGGEPSTNEGDWVFLAASLDGDDLKSYVAEPSSDYTVSEVAQTAVPGTTTADWSNSISFGRETAGDRFHFEGGIDISFYAPGGRTESDLQTFVDNSKELYE